MQPLRADEALVEARIPFNERFEIMPGRGLSNGLLTTAVDSIFGLAILVKLGRRVPIATIDLKMEFIHDAVSRENLICRAVCYAVTKLMAYARGTVIGESTNALLASGSGTFMIGTRGPSFDQQKG